MKQTLLILRGAPASGKSFIAKNLRDFKKKIAWLKVDNFKPFFADDASEALNYVNGSALATLEYLLSEGFSVVMEGVFQDPSFVEKATEMAKNKNISAHVYQLQSSLSTLIERDKNRPEVKSGHRKPMEVKVMEKILQTIKEHPVKNAEIFNTENKSKEELITVFQKHFSAPR